MNTEEILNHYGWRTTGDSPRTIKHEDGSMANGLAVEIIEQALAAKAESEGL